MLLRQLAFAECITELRVFANADQKLGLRYQRQRLDPMFPSDGRERREVHVGGDVLIAGRVIDRVAQRMFAK